MDYLQGRASGERPPVNLPPIIIKLANGRSFRDVPISMHLKIAKELTEKIGAVKNLEAKKGGDLFVTFEENEALEKSSSLTTLCDQEVKVSLPKSLLRNVGVIDGVPKSLSSEEILDNLSEYGVMEVYQLWNVSASSTDGKSNGSVKLVFKHNFLNKLPKQVSIGFITYAVRQFVPSPFQCNKCFGLKHTTNLCTKKEQACDNCGKPHDHGLECATHCVNCGSHDHKSKDKNNRCPRYIELQKALAISTTEGISLRAALDKMRMPYLSTSNQGTRWNEKAKERLVEQEGVASEVKKLKEEMQDVRIQIQRIPQLESKVQTLEAKEQRMKTELGDMRNTLLTLKQQFSLIQQTLDVMLSFGTDEKANAGGLEQMECESGIDTISGGGSPPHKRNKADGKSDGPDTSSKGRQFTNTSKSSGSGSNQSEI